MFVWRRAIGFAVAVFLMNASGCTEASGSLVIGNEVPLLENPYPLGYPSTNPKPNRILRLLKDERVVLFSERVEKDYLVYEVRTNDGIEGYVIAEPGGVKEQPTSKESAL